MLPTKEKEEKLCQNSHFASIITKSLYQQLHTVEGLGCYLFSLDPVDPAATAHTRFFNPTEGIAEDPATGTAAGPPDLLSGKVRTDRIRGDSDHRAGICNGKAQSY
jgi:hypothetical protein